MSNALPVTEVADYTGSPEILGGRVKTLHPAIHGGLLARDTEADRADLDRINADYIDLVAVNLYPFEQTIAQPDVTLADAIENIDIGGVTLIRAGSEEQRPRHAGLRSGGLCGSAGRSPQRRCYTRNSLLDWQSRVSRPPRTTTRPSALT